jgi:predicted Zn-dependent protease
VDDEAQLLARAFRHLRGDGDASAALASLDERDRRFGAGPLGAEAALARAEALLLLGRATEALPVLLAIRGERAGQTPAARATRAELLARANRCGEAEADFTALLATGAPAVTRERALYARASCRLRGGQPSAAIPDLQGYLTEYPEGRFAPAVREALAKLRRP